MHKKIKRPSTDLTRVTRTIYYFIGFFALSIIIFDSGNLITKQAVIQRWTAISILLIINTFVWFIASQKNNKNHSLLLAFLSIGMTIFSGLVIYWERGMASSSTIFFALPLLIAALAKNRHLLISVSALSTATYSLASVKYFNDYFNEGYRVQLWGNIILYSGTMFVCAWLIMVLTGLRKDSR